MATVIFEIGSEIWGRGTQTQTKNQKYVAQIQLFFPSLDNEQHHNNYVTYHYEVNSVYSSWSIVLSYLLTNTLLPTKTLSPVTTETANFKALKTTTFLHLMLCSHCPGLLFYGQLLEQPNVALLSPVSRPIVFYIHLYSPKVAIKIITSGTIQCKSLLLLHFGQINDDDDDDEQRRAPMYLEFCATYVSRGWRELHLKQKQHIYVNTKL